MGNMSYCRFANTLADLQDCYENIEDTDNLDPEEASAREHFSLSYFRIGIKLEDGNKFFCNATDVEVCV